MRPYMSLTGDVLRQQRETLGLSQAKLSELTGIAQHRLSAFELGKLQLAADLLDVIAKAIADGRTTQNLVRRAKRYRNHEYRVVPHLTARVARVRRTPGNHEYLLELNQLALAHAQDKGPTFSAVSLFSGCGGFSLGFSAAGFHVKGFLEINHAVRQIYKDNFPNSRELGFDIEELDQPAVLDLARGLGPVDVLIGGPPCQGFSLSGRRRVNDPRNTLFKHYLRVVDTLRPRLAIMENVRLLTSMKNPSGGLIKDDILNEFSAHGYAVRLFEVNAKDYGVPQHRERVLFVAVRQDLDLKPSIPEPTHGTASDLFTRLKPVRTFGDACSDLAYLESGDSSHDLLHVAVRHPQHVIEWLWDLPEGSSAHENKDPAKRPPSGYNTTYKRQVWDEPAATVQTTFGMISGCRNVHPIATRSLTIREAARLQAFPDSFSFRGSLGVLRSAIGNAVPPLLAYRLATHVKGQLLKLVKVSSL